MSRSVTRVCLAVALLLPVHLSGQSAPPSERDASKLTIDRLYSLPNLIGTAPRGFSWSADGRYLAFLWNDDGMNFHDVWIGIGISVLQKNLWANSGSGSLPSVW